MDVVKAKKTALDVMRSYIILKNYMKEHSTPVGVPMWSSSRSIEGLSDYILQTDNLDLYNVAYRDMDYSFLVDCSISLSGEIDELNIDISNDNDPTIYAHHSINAMCRTYVTLTDWFVRSGKMLKDQQAGNGRALEAQSLNPEPQQEQPKQEITASTIPTINDTDKEKLVFGNALQKQYMSLEDGCYKWALTKSLLAYMCGRLYCGDIIKEDDSDYSQKYIKGNIQMPAQEVKALFGVDVASNRYPIKEPPRNSWRVDELFKSNGASK